MTVRKVFFFCRKQFRTYILYGFLTVMAYFALNLQLEKELNRNKIDVKDPFVINYFNFRGNRAQFNKYLNSWIAYNGATAIKNGVSPTADQKIISAYLLLPNIIKNNLEIGMQWRKLNNAILTKETYQRLTDIACNYRDLRLSALLINSIVPELSNSSLSTLAKDNTSKIINSTGLSEQKFADLLYKMAIPSTLAKDEKSEKELRAKYNGFKAYLEKTIKDHLKKINAQMSAAALSSITDYINLVLFQALNDSIASAINAQLDNLNSVTVYTAFNFLANRYAISSELLKNAPLYLNFTKLLFDSIIKSENLANAIAELQLNYISRLNFNYAIGDSPVKKAIFKALLYSTSNTKLPANILFDYAFAYKLDAIMNKCEQMAQSIERHYGYRWFLFYLLTMIISGGVKGIIYNINLVRFIYIRYFSYLLEYDDWMFSVMVAQICCLFASACVYGVVAYYGFFATHYGVGFLKNYVNILYTSSLKAAIYSRVTSLITYALLNCAIITAVFYNTDEYYLSQNLTYAGYFSFAIDAAYKLIAEILYINIPLTKKCFALSVILSFEKIAALIFGKLLNASPFEPGATISNFVYESLASNISRLSFHALNRLGKPWTIWAFDIIYGTVIALSFIAPLIINLKYIPYFGVEEFVVLS